jgi:hypothetical protein
VLKRMHHRYSVIKDHLASHKDEEMSTPVSAMLVTPLVEAVNHIPKRNLLPTPVSRTMAKPNAIVSGEEDAEKLSGLRLKKKTLQKMLAEYQAEFVKRNGRPVKSSVDREPIRVEYQEYKEIKVEIARLEGLV